MSKQENTNGMLSLTEYVLEGIEILGVKSYSLLKIPSIFCDYF